MEEEIKVKVPKGKWDRKAKWPNGTTRAPKTKKDKYTAPPVDMGEVAKEKWGEIFRNYRRENIDVLKLDLTLIRLFCEAYERYCKARDELKDFYNSSLKVEDVWNDKTIKNLMKAIKDNVEIMNKLSLSLYLSPTSRKKLIPDVASERKIKEANSPEGIQAFFEKLNMSQIHKA